MKLLGSKLSPFVQMEVIATIFRARVRRAIIGPHYFLNPSHTKVAPGLHVLSEVSSWYHWSLLMSRRIAPRSTIFPIT